MVSFMIWRGIFTMTVSPVHPGPEQSIALQLFEAGQAEGRCVYLKNSVPGLENCHP